VSQPGREFAHDRNGFGYGNYAFVRFKIIPRFAQNVRNLRPRESTGVLISRSNKTTRTAVVANPMPAGVLPINFSIAIAP
jgi:hypothetical protein